MKTIIQTTFLFFTMIISSCMGTNQRDKLRCPSEYPQWVKDKDDWNQEKQRAYQQGRIYFDKDSSMMLIGTGKPINDSIWIKAKQNLVSP